MSKPIYQLFVANHTVASAQARNSLSEAEQKALQDQDQASRDAVGAEVIVACDSAWADEMHPWWGVIKFPDLQARIEHSRTLQKIGWFNYVEAWSLLGTQMAEPETLTVPNPVYQLWIIKNNPAIAMTANYAKGLNGLMWEKHGALYKEYCSQVPLVCDSSWCNEGYPAFGLSVFPDFEAHMKIQEGLNDLGWQRNFESVTYLGIPLS
jgi:hypothetical protein